MTRPNLMGVGQEKYFYKLVNLTDKEEQLLELLIIDLSPPSLQKAHLDYLNMFTAPYKLKVILDSKATTTKKKQIVQSEIKKLEAYASVKIIFQGR